MSRRRSPASATAPAARANAVSHSSGTTLKTPPGSLGTCVKNHSRLEGVMNKK